jgi:hypothetical protein
MPKQAPWFIEERAFAFVSLVLTKRNDLIVRHHGGRDIAIDLLVEVLKDGKSTLRFFGVQMVGYIDLPDIKDADQKVLSHLGRDPFEAVLPICVFVVGVRKPEGIYRWIVEPIVSDGQALLNRDVEPNWQDLDQKGADRLIAQVNAWYDARKEISSAKARGRHSKMES